MAESITSPGFCTDLSGYYPVHDYIPGLQTNIGIVLLAAGLLNVFMSLVTVFWIRRQRYLAQEETDNDEAVNSVIFPVFVRLLWLSVTVNIFSGIVVILVPLHRAGENTPITSALYGFLWAMQHGVLEGVAFLLMQKGCGQHAAKRARMWSFWWISVVFVLMFCAFYYGSVITAVLSAMRDAVLVLFYLILYIAPQEKLFRRPAALYYSRCWLSYRAFFLLLYILMIVTDTEYLGNCGYIVLSLFIFAIIQPLIMYTTLLRDSWWWQGVEINTNTRTARNAEQDIRYPLRGSEYSLQSAQALAGTVDDMRVRGNVTMLNFACIKMNSNKTLGAGSFSKVYKGTYRGKDCAIKLIYTVDITAETIKKVAAEASILSSIRHKNIVSILGVSVLPPSVCLILELCSFGSLSDLIRGYGFDWSSSHRSPLRLSYADVLYLALGCARGLAAVHSYDSTLCHRDVKSFNFLVDHQFNVKIADLELGIMTGQGGLSAYDVPGRDPYAEEAEAQALENPLGEDDALLAGTGSGAGSGTGPGVPGGSAPGSPRRPAEMLAPSRRSDPECVNVNELLANWLAPEVILERKFQQASDIYALGTVLWEILSAQLPFDGEFPVNIRRKIVSGYTHPIPARYLGTEIASLISSCWAFDPRQRPTSSNIAMTLETVLNNQCYGVIKNIDSIPDTAVLRSFYDQHYRKSVYGDSSLHKYLFADLRGPSFVEYVNPMNWMRYLYNVYSQPREEGKYRGLSVDDDEGSAQGDNSPSLSDSGAGSDQRDSLHRRLFEPGDDGSESGMLSRSSYVMSDDQSGGARAMYAQMPRAAMDVIGVIKEEAYWDELEASGIAWAVTTVDAPYIVMHATSAWYKLFNIKHSIGSYHHMYSIMSLIGRDTTVEGANGATVGTMNAINTSSYTSSNAYVREWKEPTGGGKNKSTHHSATHALLTEMHEGYRTNNYKQVHGVLCFSLANKKPVESPRTSRGSFSVSSLSTTAAPPQGHNLMCTLHVYPIFASPVEEAPAAAVDILAQSSTTPSKPYQGLNSLLGDKTNTNSPLRGLVTSPLREFQASALTSNLASVSASATSAKNPTPAYEAPLLRRSATQTPYEAPTLRRSNTQVSHTSFASSIRTSMRAPDVPRPVYYAIQFHELSEHAPDAVTDDVVPSPAPGSPRQHVAHSPENSGGTGGGGLLSALGIGRFWSSDKNKDRSGKSPQSGNAKTYSGSFTGPSAAGVFRPDELISSHAGNGSASVSGSRNSRHSVS